MVWPYAQPHRATPGAREAEGLVPGVHGPAFFRKTSDALLGTTSWASLYFLLPLSAFSVLRLVLGGFLANDGSRGRH